MALQQAYPGYLGSRGYHGSVVALLTQHGKEQVIAPVLEQGLGCTVELVTGYDTDQLGTFTREVPRPGGQLSAARLKARKGMELSGRAQGLASEGSFGPDPHTGLFTWNVEVLVWIDEELGIEIVGMAQGPARSGQIRTGDWQQVEAFAQKEGFPRQQLVVRAASQDDPRLDKGIADWARLREVFDARLAQAANRQVFVELDCRAFANPARMQNIEKAAQDLLQRLQSTCPACETPGYWIAERLPGLPCASCGRPTHVFQSERWHCARCDYQSTRDRTDCSAAPARECGHCNP